MTKKIYKPRPGAKSKSFSNRGLAAKVALVESQTQAIKMPKFGVGDTLKVHVKIKEGSKERIQAFEGTVISRKHGGVQKSFILRKVSHGVGVERVFLESSPKLAKVERVTPGKVRRSKLYYLRSLEGKAAKIQRDIGEAMSSAKDAAAAKKAAEKTAEKTPKAEKSE